MSKSQALAQGNLCAAFQVTANAQGTAPALTPLDSDGVTLTWSEYADSVRKIATGLYSLGVRGGDVVCAMLQNRPEFHQVDVAVMHLGAIGSSLYNGTPAARIAPMLENSGSRVIVTERVYLGQIREAAQMSGNVESIVVVDGDRSDLRKGELTLDDLQALECAGFDFDAAWRAVTADTIACLCYSSGTTGEPKGVEFSHRALMFHVNSIERLSPPSPDGRVISYLPMAHMGERYMGHYGSLVFGFHVHTLIDGSKVTDHLTDVRPTRFFGVPRVYEKVAATAMAMVKGSTALRGAAARLREEAERRSDGDSSTSAQTELSSDAHSLLFAAREAVGLESAELLGLGAAGPPRELMVQLHSLGLPVLEFYGLTEAIMVTANSPEAFRFGTAGRPLPGVETSLGADGELLVKGRGVFTRYRGRPDLTAEAFTEDGWLKTGDVAQIDADGFHSIVDRKKELIVTVTGKNVAPRLLENLLLQASPLIGHAVAIGNGRRYMGALVVLDDAEVRARGIDVAEAASNSVVLAEVEAAVATVNAQVAKAESIRAWRVLPTSWPLGGDELTATGKLRRKPIVQKYDQEIESLYGE